MTQVQAKDDRYVSEFRALQKSREGREPEWLSRARAHAFAQFTELGFPTARRGNERWKYTSVAPIAAATFRHPPAAGGHPAAGALDGRMPTGDGWVTLGFLDGRYSPSLSTPSPKLEGARISSLATALEHDGHVVEEHLGRYAVAEDDGFTALNTAFADDGAILRVEREARLASPVHLVHVSAGNGSPTASHPRNLIVAGRNSEATIVETYLSLSPGRDLTNTVTEIVLEEGAKVDHYRLLLNAAGAFHVGATRVHQSRDSSFTSASVARGAALARHDLLVTLDAPGTYCSLNGLYVTSGKEHIDNFINIDHASPHTTSRLYYKGILDGSSKAVFGGTVLVRKDAQKADAQQSDKNLLLSDDAEVNSKPSLLIYADDVKCGHGATAGHIDLDTLFYMMSRGLDRKTASALLVRGFAGEIIDQVRLEPLQQFLEGSFLDVLSGSQLGGGR
ncbi:MAG: Fe-S cluster assembly protein SufD [Dehalococcoidia bacterium]|nr:Fe-S cluster assembly protein SufD [Dehalococcoidia bacterium]